MEIGVCEFFLVTVEPLIKTTPDVRIPLYHGVDKRGRVSNCNSL